MRPAHIDAGTFGGIFHFQDIYLNALRRPEDLPLHLFPFAEHGVRLAQINAHVPAQVALYYACHHISFFFIVLVIDYAALLFPDLLEYHVFRILGGNAPEFFGLDLLMEHVADFCSGGKHSCIVQGNLQAGILHLFLGGHDLLLRIHQEITGIPVNLDMHIVRLAKMILAGSQQ